MSKIPILEVISFSTEHNINKVQNIVKNSGKWTNQIKNVSLRGKEIYEITAEFKLPMCKIEAIDLGNFWSANVELQIGRSGESISSRIPLLKRSPLNLMTKLDCCNGNNAEVMSFLTRADLNPQVLVGKGWDRLHVTCHQPHKNDVYFGLSMICVRGKRLDEINLERNVPKFTFKKDVTKDNLETKATQQTPEYFVPGSRASKLLAKSMKRGSFEFKSTQENRKKPDFLSPERKKMRDEDDLKQNKTENRNQVVLQDVGNYDIPDKPTEKKYNFKFKSKADTSNPSKIQSNQGDVPNLDSNDNSNSKIAKTVNIKFSHKSANYSENSKSEPVQRPSTEPRKPMYFNFPSVKSSENPPIPKSSTNPRFKFTSSSSTDNSKNDPNRPVPRFNFPSLSNESPRLDQQVPITPVTITTKEDFLKYTNDQLKRSGILVQHRSYKRSRDLPLLKNKVLRVEAEQKITFYKQGKLILICSKNKLYEPAVDPEHVAGIFKDYTEAQISASDLQESKIEDIIEDKKCPLCMKNFGQNEEKLIEHASNCDGIEEVAMDTCPICEREFPPERLSLHAQECAQQFYD